MKNYEEYVDDFPLYKFYLSRSWYESKDSSIQRLANRIHTHPLLDIPVTYLKLATAACHQLLSSKKDDQQQQPTIIFEDINFIKALVLNEHELIEVFIQIIMSMREWYIIFCNQDNLNKYSLNQFTLHAQSKIEIDFKEQKSLTIPDRWTTQDITSAYQYGVRGNYHDNICGIGQEEIYNLDLWIFSMNNKIEEPIFTFESIVIQ
ncbi:unnamed protein product [Adineta steineri]|uniref:Uncharacterized protein n=1 Tax=Adineta steineri TaxID=433720 RepID=A0A814Z899_9BILA|nr:unnamed protein product [Adineta steineri]CAF1529022.1 unnamed protein product [Adineta steineri]